MTVRERFIRQLLEWNEQQKAIGLPTGDAKPQEYFSEAQRLTMLLDGIKLIGSGNGAGALASIAAMYYFSGHAELHAPLKAAALFFGSGLLIFAFVIFGFLFGLMRATSFVETYQTVDKTTVPMPAFDKAMNGLIALVLSLLGAFASLGCFIIGLAIGLITLARF